MKQATPLLRRRNGGYEFELANYPGMAHPFFAMSGAVDASRRATTQATDARRRPYQEATT